VRAKTLVVLIAPLVMASVPAQAQGRGGPCRQEIEKLCPNVAPGGIALRDCINQHAAELSPQCQKRVAHMKARMEAWRQACKDDVQKLCPQEEPGHGNIGRCLRQHHDQLSQACQDQLAQRHRRGRRQPGPGPTAGASNGG
jgi:Cysteine rich repeat